METRAVTTELGEITYSLTIKRVKNMNLRLGEDGAVLLSVNAGVPKEAADDFVKSRGAWIFAHRGRQETREALPQPDKGAALPLLAAALERVYPLVEPLGVARPTLKVRYMTSRWGSCHYAQGIVVMNTALTLVPQELMDYVTLHELVHFLHPNHGAGFYRVMDRLLPDWRERRGRLRGYRLG